MLKLKFRIETEEYIYEEYMDVEEWRGHRNLNLCTFRFIVVFIWVFVSQKTAKGYEPPVTNGTLLPSLRGSNLILLFLHLLSLPPLPPLPPPRPDSLPSKPDLMMDDLYRM